MSFGSLKTVKLSYLRGLESVLITMFNSIPVRIVWPPSIHTIVWSELTKRHLQEFLCVYEASFASLTGETTFLNENAQTISFWVFDESVLMAEHMICHKIADPNIRLQSGAFVKAGTITYRQGDARDLTKEIEDGCDYLIGREVAKGNGVVSCRTGTTDATVAPTTARDSGPEGTRCSSRTQ